MAFLTEKPNAQPGERFRSAAVILNGSYLAPPEDKDGKLWVRTSAIVQRDANELYALWRDVKSIPQWQEQVRQVTTTGPRTSRWVMENNGKAISWDAEIVNDEPGKRIAWRSIGGDLEQAGEVIFEPAPTGRGTMVTVLQEFTLSKVASALQTLVGRNPKQAVIENLRHFKALAETGEIPRTQGQPHGPRGIIGSAKSSAYGETIETPHGVDVEGDGLWPALDRATAGALQCIRPRALANGRRRNGLKPSLLTPEVLEGVRLRLAEPQPDGGLWSSRKVADVMAAHLGLECVLPQRGWEALKALDWSLQRPHRRTRLWRVPRIYDQLRVCQRDRSPRSSTWKRRGRGRRGEGPAVGRRRADRSSAARDRQAHPHALTASALNARSASSTSTSCSSRSWKPRRPSTFSGPRKPPPGRRCRRRQNVESLRASPSRLTCRACASWCRAWAPARAAAERACPRWARTSPRRWRWCRASGP